MINFDKKQIIYEGKAKILYDTIDDAYLIQFFKDDATAFNAKKFKIISSKGIINNFISSFFMEKLTENGINNHFVKRINSREQLVKKLKIIPVEFVIRNFAFGSILKRYGIKEEYEFTKPLVELFYKDDDLNDPLINDDHAIEFNWLNKDELINLKEESLKINKFLINIFKKINIQLIDFKIEFGFTFDKNGKKNIMLADEISPDNCRLWDTESKLNFDKDLFRNDTGNLVQGYLEIVKRLKINIES